MLLLAIDTSGRNGSLALARGETADKIEILELLPLAGRMYSAQLIPQLKIALERHQLTKADLDGFAVVAGPGSFTGLRVGLSTVKALADVLKKPIAAVSVLQAAARVTGSPGHVIVAVDAGRQLVFVGDYEIDPDLTLSSSREVLLPVGDFLNSVKGSSAFIASADRIVLDSARQQGVKINEIAAPQADTIARLGFEQLIAGRGITAEVLEPNYLRPSDAELFSVPRMQR
jgi:tRNA threonylcarbamoyladenosine biosynthesis protein TsaB